MKIFKLILLITLISIALFFILRNYNGNSVEISPANLLEIQKISPTPLPFYELTIPYLREKTYESNLGDLETSYETQTYSAYLTNYDSDGLKINGLITKPAGKMPKGGWPAIIFVHGYILPTQYQTLNQYYDYVDFLARNDFVVFKIDLRGHGNSEGQASGAYYSADYIIDTLNAYAALETSGFVNSAKIGLWAHSMGGNVVMRSFAAKPEIPAVVIWAGAVFSYTDREKYGINDNSYRPPVNITARQNRRQQLFDTYGDFDPEHFFWKQFVPTNYVSDLKGAIQINHAVNDDVVNIGYSRDLTKLLDETSVLHELHEYQSGGHNISGASFVEAMQNTVEFYKKYLGK